MFSYENINSVFVLNFVSDDTLFNTSVVKGKLFAGNNISMSNIDLTAVFIESLLPFVTDKLYVSIILSGNSIFAIKCFQFQLLAKY